jgi:hypothetical protein
MPYTPTGRKPGRPRKGEERTQTNPDETPTKPRRGKLLSRAQIANATEGLKPQEAIAASEIIQGAKRSAAARLAGLHPSTLSPSKACGQRVQSAVLRALHRAGATPTKAAKRLAESLDAQETKFFPTLAELRNFCRCRACGSEWSATKDVIVCPKCESEEWAVFVGQDIPSRDLVAHAIRLDAVRETFKLHGAYPKESTDSTPQGPPSVQILVVAGNAPQSASSLLSGAVSVRVRPAGGNGNGGNGHG